MGRLFRQKRFVVRWSYPNSSSHFHKIKMWSGSTFSGRAACKCCCDLDWKPKNNSSESRWRWTALSSQLPVAHCGLAPWRYEALWSSIAAPKVNFGHKVFRPVIIWLLFTQDQKTNEGVISACCKNGPCCWIKRQQQETGFIWIIICICDLHWTDTM